MRPFGISQLQIVTLGVSFLFLAIAVISPIISSPINSPVLAASSGTACTSTPASGDITGGYSDTTHTSATLTNHSTECSYQVGIAAYQAYLPYSSGSNRNWIYTQTFYASKTATLAPGKTVHLTVTVPACAWQSDIFWGTVLKKFTSSQTYSAQHRLIGGGWYETSLAVCQKSQPTATPVPTATPAITSTPIPPTKLPTTGPGETFGLSLISLIGGLVAVKYWKLS